MALLQTCLPPKGHMHGKVVKNVVNIGETIMQSPKIALLFLDSLDYHDHMNIFKWRQGGCVSVTSTYIWKSRVERWIIEGLELYRSLYEGFKKRRCSWPTRTFWRTTQLGVDYVNIIHNGVFTYGKIMHTQCRQMEPNLNLESVKCLKRLELLHHKSLFQPIPALPSNILAGN